MTDAVTCIPPHSDTQRSEPCKTRHRTVARRAVIRYKQPATLLLRMTTPGAGFVYSNKTRAHRARGGLREGFIIQISLTSQSDARTSAPSRASSSAAAACAGTQMHRRHRRCWAPPAPSRPRSTSRGRAWWRSACPRVVEAREHRRRYLERLLADHEVDDAVARARPLRALLVHHAVRARHARSRAPACAGRPPFSDFQKFRRPEGSSYYP